MQLQIGKKLCQHECTEVRNSKRKIRHCGQITAKKKKFQTLGGLVNVQTDRANKNRKDRTRDRHHSREAESRVGVLFNEL